MKMMMLLLLDHKHCNKMRIVENTLETRLLIKTFAEMCNVELDYEFIEGLFTDTTEATLSFSNDNGRLLEITRKPFTTRF